MAWFKASKPCGCVVVAIVDDVKHDEDIGNNLRTWLRDGLIVTRTAAERAWAERCDDHSIPVRREKEFVDEPPHA
jgi:hypothetical protein